MHDVVVLDVSCRDDVAEEDKKGCERIVEDGPMLWSVTTLTGGLLECVRNGE